MDVQANKALHPSDRQPIGDRRAAATAAVVDLTGRNPNCSSGKALAAARCASRSALTTFSKILEMAGSRLMGRYFGTSPKCSTWALNGNRV